MVTRYRRARYHTRPVEWSCVTSVAGLSPTQVDGVYAPPIIFMSQACHEKNDSWSLRKISTKVVTVHRAQKKIYNE